MEQSMFYTSYTRGEVNKHIKGYRQTYINIFSLKEIQAYAQACISTTTNINMCQPSLLIPQKSVQTAVDQYSLCMPFGIYKLFSVKENSTTCDKATHKQAYINKHKHISTWSPCTTVTKHTKN